MHPRAESAPLSLVLVAGLVLAASPGGCSATGAGSEAQPPGRLVSFDTRFELRLSTLEDGPSRSLRVAVLVEPLDGLPLEVAPADGESAGLLELRVRWQDFGAAPASVGRTTQVVLPWSVAGLARPGAPLVLSTTVALGEPGEALARRVTVEGRVIGIELLRDDLRSGGLLRSLPAVQLEMTALPPAGSLERHLAEGDPEGIFLAAAAVSGATERREEVLGRLIEALPDSGGAAREALFGALLFLTGETHGRDTWRWTNWWRERSRLEQAAR